MLIRFSAAKKGLPSLFREFFAGKSTFISFSRYFIALKTVAIPYEDGHHSNEDGREGDEDGRRGDKLPDLLLNIWNAICLRSQIFDSPGVKLYHIASVSGFR